MKETVPGARFGLLGARAPCPDNGTLTRQGPRCTRWAAARPRGRRARGRRLRCRSGIFRWHRRTQRNRSGLRVHSDPACPAPRCPLQCSWPDTLAHRRRPPRLLTCSPPRRPSACKLPPGTFSFNYNIIKDVKEGEENGGITPEQAPTRVVVVRSEPCKKAVMLATDLDGTLLGDDDGIRVSARPGESLAREPAPGC